jgi:hypothetical protein
MNRLVELLRQRIGKADVIDRCAIVVGDSVTSDVRMVSIVTLDAEDELPRVRPISPDQADVLAEDLRLTAGAARAHNEQLKG